jgi:NADPH:quinone reductase-like Zn-dependent oxidoreductase
MMAVGLRPIFKRPRTAEHDFAGTVIDANDTSFKNGDKVWGFMALQRDDQGALAQYIAATEDQVTLRPPDLSLQQAAGLGCVGVTAEKCIFQDAKVQPGQTVLVVGGEY